MEKQSVLSIVQRVIFLIKKVNITLFRTLRADDFCKQYSKMKTHLQKHVPGQQLKKVKLSVIVGTHKCEMLLNSNLALTKKKFSFSLKPSH